jgi:hypothetical protein
MTWQQIVLAITLVVGGVVLGITNHETLAATVLGAAAGFLSQPLGRARVSKTELTSTDVD